MKAIVVIGMVLELSPAALAVPVDQVSDLKWLAGTWVEDKGGMVTRETWLMPLGGTMSGVDQTNEPGKKPAMDFMAITTEPAGITFTAIVGHQPPTPFVLKPGQPGKLVFENLGHDFPQRVMYWRCGPENADLCARIEGTMNGAAQAQDWHYRRGS